MGWVALAASLLGLFAAGQALPIEPWLRAFNEWVRGVGAWSIVIFIVVYENCIHGKEQRKFPPDTGWF